MPSEFPRAMKNRGPDTTSRLDPDALFHIAEKAVWVAQTNHSAYQPAAFEDEGFVHLSTSEQVAATAGRYYHNRDDLVLLEIHRQTVDEHIVEENLLGGSELFPHLYARVPKLAIARVLEIYWGSNRQARFRPLPVSVDPGYSCT